MLGSVGESDEAIARRLQMQEMGGVVPDANTPLVSRQNNPTVINARINELTGSRATLCIIFTINMPQVLAAFIVLCMHWMDEDVCDKNHTLRWKWWALLAAMRMFFYSLIVLLMHVFRTWLNDRPDYQLRAVSIRNSVDAFGLVWFVVGNLWLLADDDSSACLHPARSPIYNLCISLLVINYLQICLPCIVAITLIPVCCFCMPCLIRILARMQSANLGASDTAISNLPIIKLEASHLDGDVTCPICLNDLAVGDEARLFRCNHLFHKTCVDEWLRQNASCPTCRKKIFDNPQSNDTNSGNTTAGESVARAPYHQVRDDMEDNVGGNSAELNPLLLRSSSFGNLPSAVAGNSRSRGMNDGTSNSSNHV